MNKIKTYLPILIIILLAISCTKEDTQQETPCSEVWERVETNRAEVYRKCDGLANDYPLLYLLEDKMISMNCDAFTEGVEIEQRDYCDLVITKKTTIYKI